MSQGFLKTMEKIGAEAGKSYVKSGYQSAEVYFGLPLEVVKVVKQPPTHPVYAKLSRQLATALSKAYSYIQGKFIKSKGEMSANEVFSVTEGDITVVLSGSMKVLEIGTTLDLEDKDAAQAFLRDVVVAANAGYLKVQIEATKFAKELKNI